MSLRLILAFVLGFVWWLCVYFSIKSQIENDLKFNDKKYGPIISGVILPIGLLIGFVYNIVVYGVENATITFLNYCLNLIIIFSVYYVLIFGLLKLFRKYLHPLVVASLWLLPNLLYFFITYKNEFIIENIFIIELSPIVVILLFSVWIIGFGLICSYKIYEHINYRNQILADTEKITDDNTIAIFEIEKNKMDNKKVTIDLVQSNYVQTPITIGVRKKVLVLPNKDYSNEELELIFNHEIIHIARGDVFTKLYIVFCNACCWFNPLMWLANKKCSEDLELSCDMSVLTHAGDNKRKQYARLILDNTTSDKGFTTCLSNDAKSLKYRLNNILHPKYKRVGGWLIFVLIFMIVSGWGNFGIAIKGYNGNDEIFDSKDLKLTEIYVINIEFKNQVYNFEYEDKIIEYISNLELSKLPISHIPDSDGKTVRLNFGPNKEVWLYDYYIKVKTNNSEEHYYVKEGIDWNYLNQYIIEYPCLRLAALVDGQDLGFKMWPPLKEVSIKDQVVYESNNNYLHHNTQRFTPTEFKVEFYNEVVSNVEVIVETEDNIETHIIEKEELSTYIIPLKNATYTIKATSVVNDKIYDVVYSFDWFTY